MSLEGNFIDELFLLGLNEKSKGNEPFVDLLVGARPDKIRQEKLKRFRELINTKFSSSNENDELKCEENRLNLSVPWKDFRDYSSDDSEHQRYLRTLNASIFLRIKALNERFLHSSVIHHRKSAEQILYQEVSIHWTYFSQITSKNALGFDRLTEKTSKFQQWINFATSNEHFPFVFIGGRATGKTFLVSKVVQHLRNQFGRNCQTILRYLNLTTRSKHLPDLFASICSQLNYFHLSSNSNRFEDFSNVLNAMSKSGKTFILMIDGLDDFGGQNCHNSLISFYETLFGLAPAKIFIVVSIGRNSHGSSSSSSEAQIRQILDRMDKSHCLVELPLSTETIEIREVTSLIKSEMRTLNENVLLNLSSVIHQQLDNQPFVFYLLRLILNEKYLFQSKHFDEILRFDFEEIFNFYIGKSKKKRQTFICSFFRTL